MVTAGIDVEVSAEGFTDGRKVHVVVATAFVGGTVFTEAGTGLRDEHDEFRDEIGAKLALGRALRDLGRQLTRTAMKEVNAR
jgi:hypothetical protein